MKKTLFVCLFVLSLASLVTGCTSNQEKTPGTNSTQEKPVATIYLEDLYNDSQEEKLKSYKGKKISLIGNFEQYNSDIETLTISHRTLAAYCDIDNRSFSSLNLNEGDKITVTGTVSNFSAVYNWFIDDCEVTK